MNNITRFQIFLFCEGLWASYGSIEGLEIILPKRLYDVALDDAKALTKDKTPDFYFLGFDSKRFFKIQTLAGVVTIRDRKWD